MSTELSPVQLQALADLLGRVTDFVIVDLRGAAPAASIHHQRAWAKGGGRRTPLQVHGVTALVRDVRDSGHRCVLLLPSREVDQDDWIEALMALPDIEAVLCDDEGTLFHRGIKLLADEQEILEDGKTTMVIVQLDREVRFTDVDLPLAIPVELPRGANADLRVGVSAMSAVDAPLPKPDWFIVASGPPKGVLEIDVEIRSGLERWRLTYRGDDGSLGGLRRARAPAPARASSHRVAQRLAVILDRTCPDRAAWSDALMTVLGGGRRGGPGPTRYDLVEDQQPSLRPADLNRELRLSLADALDAALAGADVLVDGWWVADVPGDGVSWLTGLDRPASEVHSAGTERPGALGRLFQGATWSPGLDLWDPIQYGLRDALNTLEADRGRRGAVLIVGDSPPYPPLVRNCPFHKVVRALGPMTSVRRQDPGWILELERAAALGIPVCWLFMEHDQCHPDHRRMHDQARRVQGLVSTALAESVTLVTQPADREGVLRGVRAALDATAAPEKTRIGIRTRGLEVR